MLVQVTVAANICIQYYYPVRTMFNYLPSLKSKYLQISLSNPLSCLLVPHSVNSDYLLITLFTLYHLCWFHCTGYVPHNLFFCLQAGFADIIYQTLLILLVILTVCGKYFQIISFYLPLLIMLDSPTRC